MSEQEVIVTLDGLPRPATVIDRDESLVCVRYRFAGQWQERWVPQDAVVPVEQTSALPSLPKLVGLGIVGVLGLALLVLPGGSNKPLAGISTSPSPQASASPSPHSAPSGVTAVLFGDSFAAGKGDPAGTPTALTVAATALHWHFQVRAAQGTGFTTRPSYAQRLATEVSVAPTVLLIEGGASDTSASPAQLSTAVLTVLRTLQQRFPTTRLVLVGPAAIEQPPDQALVRVSHTLAVVAHADHVPFIDQIPWITAANSPGYLSPQGFYPNAAGHAYLGRQLAAALRRLGLPVG